MSKRQLSVGRPLVWVGIAVLSAGLAVGAWFLKSSGIEAGVKGANRVAASTVKKDLAPSLTASEVAGADVGGGIRRAPAGRAGSHP